MTSLNPKLIIKSITLQKSLKKDITKTKKKIKKIVSNTKKNNLLPTNFKEKNEIKLNIIRDDLLPAGTKQRALIPYLINQKEKEFVYVSPFTGGAQITLAYATQKTDKKVTLFINKVRPRHPLTIKALSLGNKDRFNLIEVYNGYFKKMRKLCEDYINKIKKEKGEDYIREIHLGFDDKEYNDIFVKQLKKALPKNLNDNNPKRLWVPCGSTTILKALYKVLPKTHFMAVQTGKTIYPDQIDPKRTTLFRSEEHFYDKAKIQPPYPTTKEYDAKMWVFIKEHSENDDYVWNVTTDELPIKYKNFKNKDYDFDYLQIRYEVSSSPYLELLRLKKWNSILYETINYFKKNKIVLKSGKKPLKEILSANMAMWIAINFLDKSKIVDPFFPYNADKNEIFIRTIHNLGNVDMTKANKIFKELNLINKCNDAIDFIKNQKNIRYCPIIRKGNYLIYKNKEKNINFKIECPNLVYKNLSKRFIKPKKYLNDRIFCLLVRYKTLMGNSHQFAMKTEFKDALRKEYNIDFECFASSINVYYKNYCSLFYDIEKDFGSFGNFYLIKYNEGFYIANPPYEEKLLELMVLKFIKSCKETNKPLSFSFGLPHWKVDFKALDIVKKCKNTEFIRCMKDREVEWFDRLHNITVRIPSHCRCVIQNKAGKEKYPLEKFNELIDKYWVS